MSDLFDKHTEITSDACSEYAQQIAGGPVVAVKWQGHHSYTVESSNGKTIVQFRSSESPLTLEMTALAKAVHGHLAPTTSYRGRMPNSQVSVWSMEKLPGVGLLYMIHDEDIGYKVDIMVKSLAKFYAAAWKTPQVPSQDRYQAAREECEMKLIQLSTALPTPLRSYVDRTRKTLGDIMRFLPWVLTHGDLSNMNILLDQETGQLQGVVDWADAAIWPFGVALWGLESVLGYSGRDGWVWLSDRVQSHQQLFCRTFLEAVGALSSQQRALVEVARVLGILLRYGFVWKDGIAIPTNDTTLLEIFLSSALFH